MLNICDDELDKAPRAHVPVSEHIVSSMFVLSRRIDAKVLNIDDDELDSVPRAHVPVSEPIVSSMFLLSVRIEALVPQANPTLLSSRAAIARCVGQHRCKSDVIILKSRHSQVRRPAHKPWSELINLTW